MKPITFFLGLAISTSVAAQPSIRWEPYDYQTREGDTVSGAERGRFKVPERHANPDGPSIELSVIRFRCEGDQCGAPIVWLAGGPGDFGSDDIEGPYLELVRAFQAVGDVLALDQRGTGLSEPRLDCDVDPIQLPLDEPLESMALIEAYRESSRRCAEEWQARGVDLAAYNTQENADDIESLRAALGVEVLRLYGSSYGSHLGLSYIRRHPERVDRAVFSGVEGPDHSWKLPTNIDSHFAQIARRYDSAGEGRELLGLLRSLKERFATDSPRVPLGDESDEIVLGPLDLQLGLRYFLGSLDNIRQLPELCQTMWDGDYSVIAQAAASLRTVSVHSAMYYCMDCASGASPERLARIESESEDSIFGAAVNLPFPLVCEGWPVQDLGDGFRAPIRGDLPVLFLSGTLDGHTPPSNVEELIGGFPNASHVVVDNASHQYLEFAHDGIVSMLRDYFAGLEPEWRRLTAKPVFEPVKTRR